MPAKMPLPIRFRPVPAAGALLLAAALAVCARPISPYLMGQNLWNGLVEGVGVDQLWPAVEEGGFRIIRIGGIHNNESMPADAVILRQVDSIRSIGAEPLVQVSTFQSAQRAADLVRHLNVVSLRKVRFWSIGNEPTCGKAADAGVVAGIAESIRARSSAMKAVDPDIRIAIGEECYWRPELYDALLGGGADVSGRDAAGRTYADIAAFHSYPFPGVDKNRPYTRQEVLDRGASTLRAFLAACTARVAHANARHGRAGKDALVCAVTEFNITYWNVGANTARGVGTRSFLAGQFMAEVYGDGARLGAFAVMPWSIHEGGGSGGGSDLGMFDGQGPYSPRPTWHHARLVAQHLVGESVAAAGSDPLLKAFGARRGDTASLLLMNLSETEGRRVAVGLDGTSPPGTRTAVALAAGFAGVHTDSIGPQETLVLRLHRTGHLLTRIRYDVARAEAGQAPSRQDFPLPVAIGAGGGRLAAAGTWPGTVRLEGRRLAGTVPAGVTGEIRLTDLEGREAGRTRAGGGVWELALPERAGLHVLTLRAGRTLHRRAVLVPDGH